MNRTIKFRGKRLDNGEWVYGSLAETHGKLFIGIPTDLDNPVYTMNWHGVAPASVGQFTGLLDKNGRKIYEGDIILCKGKHQYKVEWLTDGFMMRGDRYGGITSIKSFLPIQREIIGNIHSNPELLNEK